MFTDLRDLLFLILFTIGMSSGVALAILPIAYLTERQVCYSKYQDYGPDFGVFSGCRIEYKGKLLPVDNALQLLDQDE